VAAPFVGDLFCNVRQTIEKILKNLGVSDIAFGEFRQGDATICSITLVFIKKKLFFDFHSSQS
jgi:hypothetical protein